MDKMSLYFRIIIVMIALSGIICFIHEVLNEISDSHIHKIYSQ